MIHGSIFKCGVGKICIRTPIEEPWSVGGNIGRLIRPVVEVVVAEQANVRQENSGVDVNAVQRIDVVTAVGFCQIAVGSIDIPLPLRGLGSLRGVVAEYMPNWVMNLARTLS